MRLRLLVCATLLGITSLQSRASDLSEFNTMVTDACAFYRNAVFHLRTGNVLVAGFELEQMRERWMALTNRFADTPPDARTDEMRSFDRILFLRFG